MATITDSGVRGNLTPQTKYPVNPVSSNIVLSIQKLNKIEHVEILIISTTLYQ